MTRRTAPSKRDRHGSRVFAMPVGVALRGLAGKTEIEPPELAPGQHRCPACRNAVALNPRGTLHEHRDLHGNPCGNRSAGAPTGIAAPPVILPRPEHLVREDRDAAPAAKKASRLDAGSLCRECGKWLPGERILCGRCYALGVGR